MVKRNLRKVLAVFLALIVLSIGALPTYALTPGNSYSFSTEYLDLYYNTGDWETADGDLHNDYGQVALRTLNATGEPLYCLQIYNGVDASVATAKDIKATNLWKNELSVVAQTGITRVSIYGYPNFRYGASAKDAQLATQVLIWEFETGARKNFSSGCDSWAKNLLYNMSTKDCYNSILEACRNHATTPSFSNDTVKLKGVGTSYAITLTDENKVLDGFSVSSSNSKIKVQKSGNTLKVWATASGNLTATITCQKDVTCIDSAFALTGANQTLFYGTIADPQYARLKVELSTGNLKIVKTSEDGVVNNVEFNVTGPNNYENTVKTNSNGTVTISELPAGSYQVSEVTSDKYVKQSTKTVKVSGGETSEINFSNKLKKFKVSVTKQDAEKKVSQGNATLSGAVYGLYHNNQLVKTYTTDKTGKFTTDYNTCGTGWTIKEITASQGYLLDNTVYTIDANSSNFTVEYNNINLTVKENVVKGSIAIIKHSDDGSTQIETPEENAEFQIYLKSANSYDNAKDYERDLIVTDEDGFAQTKSLPFGTYIVHQTKGLDGSELMPDFEVTIAENNKVYKFLLNNAPYESMVQIVKKDVDTDKVIQCAGVGFKIKDLKTGEYITQHINYPTPTDLDTFYTDVTGMLMLPETLKSGDYELYEISAPDGYVLNTEPVKFTIDGSQEVVTVEMSNKRQLGTFTLSKTGEILSGFEEKETEYGTEFVPVYSESSLAGAVYEFRAAEDIVVNGDIVYSQGEVVDTVTTTDTGVQTIELPLGKYEYQEISAPEGFVLDKTIYTAELTYQGQEVDVFTENLANTDERQKVQVSLLKDFEENKYFPNSEAYKDVVFAVYAKNDITIDGNVVLPKDSIVDYITLDKTLTGVNNTDLPLGYEWYVKEIKTAAGWYMDNGTYEFSAMAEPSADVVKVDINNGEAIVNKVVTGYVEFRKVDADNADIQLEATYGVYRASDGKLLEKKTSKIGDWVSFTELPAGKYYLQEIASPDGYLVSDMKYEFVINNDNAGETIQIVATDTKAPVKVIKETPKSKSPDTGNDNYWQSPVTASGVALLVGLSVAYLIGGKKLRIRKRRNYNH